MILVQMQDCIETFFCKENAAGSFEPKFKIVLNVQVSDTTGDAMKNQCLAQKIQSQKLIA